MMNRPREDILSDIVEWLDRSTDSAQPSFQRCFRFQLVWQGDRGSEPLCPAAIGESVEAIDRLLPDELSGRLQKIAGFFLKTAETVANRHKRVQEFRIQGYHSAEMGAPADTQMIFDVVRSGAPDDSVDGLEPAGERGERAQIQRHAEMFAAKLLEALKEKNKATDRAFEYLDHGISTMTREVESSRVEMRALFTDFMTALDRKRESEVTHARGMLRVDVEKQAYEGLFNTVLPMILDRVGIGPAGSAFREMMTTPEVVEKLAPLYPTLPESLKAKLQSAMGVYVPALVKPEEERKIGEVQAAPEAVSAPVNGAS